MVKIKLKFIVASLIVFALLLGTAHAAGSKLTFSDVDVKVGGKTDKNLNDGDRISDEAEPGDAVEFKIEVANNFTDAEGLEIEDITVEVTIEEIDDEDDLDEESADFDLDAGDDKSVTLKFQIPEEVDEDEFNVVITAEGEDENGTDHKVTMKLKLDVEKENHLLKITRATLTPTDISCNRRSVQFAATVVNLGAEDEEDVRITLKNDELGVNFEDNVEELTAEPNEDESRFSRTYNLNVPNDADDDEYPIVLSVLYDDNRKKAEETITLNVRDCSTSNNNNNQDDDSDVVEDEEEEEEQPVNVVNPPSTTGQTTTVIRPVNTYATQEGFFRSNAFVVGVIIAEVVAVIIGIVLIITLFARR